MTRNGSKRKPSPSTTSSVNGSNNGREDIRQGKAIKLNEEESAIDGSSKKVETKKQPSTSSLFRITSASEATSLTDGVRLSLPSLSSTTSVTTTSIYRRIKILPWVGYGTYKIKSSKVRQCTLEAIRYGYRSLDTAFIYGGETTERLVGQAIQDAIRKRYIKNRNNLFLVTKQWRKYHGYEPTLECLNKSLRRLQVDYIDLWLMHWPGPAYTTMNRRNDVLQEHGPWYYAAQDKESMPQIRSETWRAMEDAYYEGKVHAIGLSNCTIAHLESLKKTARMWPPAVLQIECHPLLPQTEVLKYCRKEGIVVQAYASLGGQDASRSYWSNLYPSSSTGLDVSDNSKKKKGKKSKSSCVSSTTTNLCTTPPVQQLANEMGKTPGQILLRWALDQSCTVIPKTEHVNRMVENSKLFDFTLSRNQIDQVTQQLHQRLTEQVRKSSEDQAAVVAEYDGVNPGDFKKSIKDDEKCGDSSSNQVTSDGKKVAELGRLCWKRDPLRMLDFS